LEGEEWGEIEKLEGNRVLGVEGRRVVGREGAEKGRNGRVRDRKERECWEGKGGECC
jgi:hypothetical protein